MWVSPIARTRARDIPKTPVESELNDPSTAKSTKPAYTRSNVANGPDQELASLVASAQELHLERSYPAFAVGPTGIVATIEKGHEVTVAEIVEENLPEEMEDEWNWKALANWANTRQAANYQEHQLQR